MAPQKHSIGPASAADRAVSSGVAVIVSEAENCSGRCVQKTNPASRKPHLVKGRCIV